MNLWQISLLGLVAAAFGACGPDHKPDEPCEPTFNLVVSAEPGPLPPDTRLNVQYGANQQGEPYALDDARTPQAVFCHEDTTPGGATGVSESVAATSGAGGAANEASPGNGVYALRCSLYTQGPARLDVTATGYTPIKGQQLALETNKHCEITVSVVLQHEKPATQE